MLDTEAIMQILPHRHPMLLVDRILELTPQKHCLGIKNVSDQDRLITGPGGRRFFPQTMVIEAMAQVGGFPMGSPDTPAALMVALEEFLFDGLVCPGDVIRIESTVMWQRGKIFRSSVRACTDAGFRASGQVTYAVQEGLRESAD